MELLGAWVGFPRSWRWRGRTVGDAEYELGFIGVHRDATSALLRVKSTGWQTPVPCATPRKRLWIWPTYILLQIKLTTLIFWIATFYYVHERRRHESTRPYLNSATTSVGSPSIVTSASDCIITTFWSLVFFTCSFSSHAFPVLLDFPISHSAFCWVSAQVSTCFDSQFFNFRLSYRRLRV